MPRYEFVEGSSSKFWEATLEGTSLTVSFGRIGTAGQAQTKTFTTPELAKKEYDKLVAEKTKKGYKLVGEGAAGAPASATPSESEGANSPSSATATTPPARPSAQEPPASPSAPKPPAKSRKSPAATSLRKDLYVYNEATGMLMTSRRMAGKGWDSSGNEWENAVRRGDLIPIELYQDDPFIMRVVIGDLLPQEAEEWCGRLDWKLRVPDGNLVVCGGSEYVMDEFEDEEDSYVAQYCRHVKVPRGDYKATVYMYLGSVNGRPCLEAARGGDEPDPLGEWFRRTRPDEAFPAWLHNDCVSDPREDPGHEHEWRERKPVEDPNRSYVEFLLHLTPLQAGETVALPDLEDGWFSTPTECRVPERIPIGIPAIQPEGLETEEEKQARRPTHGLHVFPITQKYERTPIKGGPVEVPVVRLERLYRLAWFCHVWSAPQARIVLPAGASFDLNADGLEYTFVTPEPEGFDLSFEGNGRQSGCLYLLQALSQRLKDVPDGTRIELDALYNTDAELKKDRPIGLHRYTGTVRDGVLYVDASFPPLQAGTLREALALSAQVEQETVIDCGDPTLADDVVTALKKHMFFSDNPAEKRGEAGVGVRDPEPVMLNFVASEVFYRKFNESFAVLNLLADDEDEDDEEDESMEAALGVTGKPGAPPRGEVLLQGADKRLLYLSDAMQMGEAVAKRIAETEREILPLGFKFVADIVCKPMHQIVIRGYAQEGGAVWAALMVGSQGNGAFEFITRFEQGAWLTVSRNMMARDELYRNAFKSPRTGGSIGEMWKELQRRSAHLSERFGAPVPLNATALGLAEDVELSIRRQQSPEPAPELELLLQGDDDRKFYSYDACIIDATAARAIADADQVMASLGFAPVGDVINTFFTHLVCRGYAQPGGDTWAIYRLEACSASKISGYWEFSTTFERGAQLESTRAAMSKDEPKRKIYRILDAKADPASLLEKHAKRKAELAVKQGPPLPVTADLRSLAAAVEASFVRLMG